MLATRLSRAFVAAALATAAPTGFGPHIKFGHGAGSAFSGGNWGGYASFGSWTTATANWTEPSMTCESSDDLVAPWVGIDGDGSSTVEQTGVATDCSSGRAVYQAWYEMYPAAPVYYSNAVSAGDHFTATVTRSGNSYTLAISDTTKGWTETTTKSLSAKHYSAEAIIESPTDSYPSVSGNTFTFTSVQFDGKTLKSTNPSALDADGGTNTWTPGAIGSDGQSFAITRH
jgi:Peptidase A4 family